MVACALERCARIFDVLVPVRCALCGDHGTHVCARCRKRLARAPLVRRAVRADVPAVVALGPYAGSLRSAVLALKFRNRTGAASHLGAILGHKLRCAVDVIIPVPLHARRHVVRGYNQAEVVAAGIASAIGVPLLSGALVRSRPTVGQASLALRERRLNVADAFDPGPEAVRLRGARVLIVDDVVTTGATIAACVSALRRSDIRAVTAAALAIKL
jgi:ComF family protein